LRNFCPIDKGMSCGDTLVGPLDEEVPYTGKGFIPLHSSIPQ